MSSVICSRLRTLALFVLSVVMGSTAQAYPLNPWGAAIPKKSIAINPYLYVYPGPTVNPVPYAGYGFDGRFDIWAGVGLLINDSGADFGTLEVFPRYFLVPELAVVAHVYYTPGIRLVPAPELHFAKTWGRFALTVNLGYRPVIDLDAGDFATGSINAFIAPEYYFSKQFSLFVEIDPWVTFEESGAQAAAIFAPGLWFALDENQKHSFSLAAQIPVPFDTSLISGGLWYSTTFGPL